MVVWSMAGSEGGYDHEACAVVHPLKSVACPVGVDRPVGCWRQHGVLAIVAAFESVSLCSLYQPLLSLLAFLVSWCSCNPGRLMALLIQSRALLKPSF